MKINANYTPIRQNPAVFRIFDLKFFAVAQKFSETTCYTVLAVQDSIKIINVCTGGI